jgi:hypothetical protein
MNPRPFFALMFRQVEAEPVTTLLASGLALGTSATLGTISP